MSRFTLGVHAGQHLAGPLLPCCESCPVLSPHRHLPDLVALVSKPCLWAQQSSSCLSSRGSRPSPALCGSLCHTWGRGTAQFSQAFPNSSWVYPSFLRDRTGCSAPMCVCSQVSLRGASFLAGATPIPCSLLLAWHHPGPCCRVGRLPREEAVIFLNDFKG